MISLSVPSLKSIDQTTYKNHAVKFQVDYVFDQGILLISYGNFHAPELGWRRGSCFLNSHGAQSELNCFDVSAI